MSRITFVFLAIMATSAYGGLIMERHVPQLDGRIVGGYDANIEDFPYQVSLRFYDSHICGASIYSHNIILTAAHCVDGPYPGLFSIEYGTTVRGQSKNVINVKSVTVHPQYNAKDINNDIAILILASSITMSDKARAIPLTTKSPAPGTAAAVSGWGTTSEGGSSPSTLKAVTVRIVTETSCKSAYGSSAITSAMLCAGWEQGGKDACQGDSGGPLAVDGQLVGIVSWGYGCARPNYPGVYTNVKHFESWIKSNAPSS